MYCSLRTTEIESVSTDNFPLQDDARGFTDVRLREVGGYPSLRITVTHNADGISGARLLIEQLSAAVKLAEVSMAQQQPQPGA